MLWILESKFYSVKMNNHALNTSQFVSINESKCLSKKDVGVIGPLPNGDLKIKIPSEDEIFGRRELDESYIFEFGDSQVEIPKNCVIVSKKPGYDVATFKTGMNWFGNAENFQKFENVVEKFIEKQYSNLDSQQESLKEDVNIITDELGIEDDVEEFETDSELSIQGKLTNGMEFELQKSSKNDPMKKFFIWKNSDDIHPCIEMRRKGSKFECKYRTPKGNFDCKHDSLTSLQSNPVDKYLISVCRGDKSEDNQKNLVDHLFKLFKYHNWQKPESGEEKIERHLEETREIKRVMEMLKNSIPEKHLEEMYTDARSKFISKK